MKNFLKLGWMLIALTLMLSFTATDALGQQPLRLKIIANLECPDNPDIMPRPAQNYRIDIGPYNIRTGDNGQARINNVAPGTHRVLVETRPEETLNYLRFYANDKSFDRTYQKGKDFTSNTGNIDLEFKDDARSPNVLSDYELAINIENCEEALTSPPTTSPPTTTPNLEVTFPDQVYHPLAIDISLTENGKPVPNAKLKVHALDLPENYKKLADYFLISPRFIPLGKKPCDNCGIPGFTQSIEQTKFFWKWTDPTLPLEVTTNAYGYAQLEFFLPIRESGAILPSWSTPIKIPISVEYWKQDSEGTESKAAEKNVDVLLNKIAVVEEIWVKRPVPLGDIEDQALSNWIDDRGVRWSDPVSDFRIRGSERVRIVHGTPQGDVPGETLQKGDGISADDKVLINPGGFGYENAPKNINITVRFLDGVVGRVIVDGTKTSSWQEIDFAAAEAEGKFARTGLKRLRMAIYLGEGAAAGTLINVGLGKVKVILIGAATLAAQPELIPVIEAVDLGVKVVGTTVTAGYFIYKAYTGPVYIHVESSIVTEFDNQSQLLVTTREGNATIYTNATGDKGFRVPAGKTAVINGTTLMPTLKDTDSNVAQDADQQLASMADAIAASPVFAVPAAGVLVPTETTVAPVGNVSAGNITAGNVTAGVPTGPAAAMIPAGKLATGMENDVDRPGNDYSNFDLPSPDPALCKQACDNDSNCKAFTYVKPGFQGTSARCWLKNVVPSAVPSSCCISGVKEEVTVTDTQLLDHTMASNVDESTNNVITRTNAFSSTDSRVYSWLSLGDARAGTVEWRWYSPDGVLYNTGSVDIPAPSGAYWDAYNVWYYIPIAGSDVANLPGNWRVDVYLDGQELLTEQFTIGDSGVIPAKPLTGVPGPGIPETLRECEAYDTEICGTWTLEGDHFNANWDTGDTGTVRIERWDTGGVVLTRYESEGISAGLSARYEGQISGNKIENGVVTWTLEGDTWSGTWKAEW